MKDIPQKALLTVPEAARALGLSQAAIRAWIAQRRITFTRIGRRAIRIPISVVNDIIENGTVPARELATGRKQQAR